VRKTIIQRVFAREMLNGIGNPTVEADVELGDGAIGRGSTPSGASTGAYEALELRDGGARYAGRGVLQAVQNVNETIGPCLVGMDATLQRKVDEAMLELDGTVNKSHLGGNAILAVSLAVANAAARSQGVPLYRYVGGLRGDRMPMPITNVMAGAETTGNKLDFEDHLAYPIAPMTFREATRACVEVYRMVGKLLEQRFGPVRVVGGAWAPPIDSEDEALSLICEAIRLSGYEGAFALGIDVAANLFYDASTGRYRLAGGEFTREALLDYYRELIARYPIRMIEDPFHEDDFDGFRIAKEQLGIMIVGDDLFVTNRKRLERGIQAGAANALLFKVNQIGTVTEALEAADTAYRAGYSVVASARSGDCEDVSVPDIVVAIGAGYMKIGAPARGERNSKYNRFMRIEEELLTGVPVM
jgi:enolase